MNNLSGFNLSAHLKHVNKNPGGASSSDAISRKFFTELDKNILEKLYTKYEPDFLLYGYTIDPFLHLVQNWINETQKIRKESAIFIKFKSVH